MNYMSYFYLATPYRKFSEGLEKACTHSAKQAGMLIKARIPVYSPVIHSHTIASRCFQGLDTDGNMDPTDAFWTNSNIPMMQSAMGLIVCKLDGWQESVGVQAEIDFFKNRNRPLVFMQPDVVPDALYKLLEDGNGKYAWA